MEPVTTESVSKKSESESEEEIDHIQTPGSSDPQKQTVHREKKKRKTWQDYEVKLFFDTVTEI